jgi:NADH-quinone oxidoreductase subunit C
MTPDELLARVVELLGPAATCATSYGDVTADVPREQWVAAATAVRDGLDLTYFDLLTGVDEQPEGFAVVLRLWSVSGRYGLLLRTRCPRDDARVPSLSGVFAGAGWHERSVAEMLDVGFDGHPGLTPLLLPDGFTGHPLRKEVALQSRLDKPWPGAKEPGESDRDVAGRPPRRKNRPLGVPPA